MITPDMQTPAPPRTWTVLLLLDWATGYLAARGFEEARLNVELLLAHVLSRSRLDLYLQLDRPLTAPELAIFKTVFQRRLSHEPVQYITGETEFMGLSFYVDRNVLIPRPETEQLVERTLETVRDMELSTASILDIGTGSGNIAVALGHFLRRADIVAIDISAEALTTAERNVSRNHIGNVRLMQLDMFDEFPPNLKFDVIVSNPPYVSLKEFAALQAEVREYEPRIATTDGADGLRFINHIAKFGKGLLNPGGALLVEIGYGQSEGVLEIFFKEGYVGVEVLQDYAGIPRIARGWRQGAEKAQTIQ